MDATGRINESRPTIEELPDEEEGNGAEINLQMEMKMVMTKAEKVVMSMKRMAVEEATTLVMDLARSMRSVCLLENGRKEIQPFTKRVTLK